jgi:hypothetical protein
VVAKEREREYGTGDSAGLMTMRDLSGDAVEVRTSGERCTRDAKVIGCPPKPLWEITFFPHCKIRKYSDNFGCAGNRLTYKTKILSMLQARTSAEKTREHRLGQMPRHMRHGGATLRHAKAAPATEAIAVDASGLQLLLGPLNAC